MENTLEILTENILKLREYTKDSLLITDDTSLQSILSIYSTPKFLTIFQPNLLLNFNQISTDIEHQSSTPLKQYKYSATSPPKLVFLLSRFLWEYWPKIRFIFKFISRNYLKLLNNINNNINNNNENKEEEIGVFQVNILCSVSNECHTLLRQDFCPVSTTPHLFVLFIFNLFI